MTGERPLCECHGEPMRVNAHHKDKTYWVCTIRKREIDRIAQKRYEQTAKAKAMKRRYKTSEKGRATTARYEAQPHRQLAKSLQGMSRIRVRY